MTRDTFILTVRHLLDNVEDEGNLLVNAMELMEDLYAMIDRPSRYRRQVIQEWGLATSDHEINLLGKELSTDMGILKFLDQTIHLLVQQGHLKYKAEQAIK